MKVENCALLRMSQYLLTNAQNGYVLVFGENLSSLEDQGWRRTYRLVFQPGAPVAVVQMLEVLVVFYVNHGNPRSSVC